MFTLLWLIPAFPFAGFLFLALAGKCRRPVVAITGCASVGLSMALALLLAAAFIRTPPPDHAYTQTLWTWIQLGDFAPSIGFHLDALSLIMTLVITGVGFLIHLYSAEYMAEDAGYQRFFAYMNLFVGNMLVLVLADNLVFLLLGWEGVGLCSYLLIGFWYHVPANGRAARKAFVITRIGDIAFLIGLFLLFREFGTLHIRELLALAAAQWTPGSGLAITTALLLLGGAVGKSAQLPLQTWLPDAMAGPTPVSALIHAATMVTAGVYLIIRTHVLFELAPPVMTTIAVIGAGTLLTAGFSALVQSDIKRVLAYSTISQLGYMFLALGAGSWAAALFHFMTHAFFKALLFLAAGALILSLNHEQNMFRMGGLRRKLPLVFWTFLIGALSLAAFPLIGSGFYSKEKILWDVWVSPHGGPVFWAIGVAGAALTALYTVRMILLVFFGATTTEPGKRPGMRIAAVLLILAALSTFAGGVELPHTFGEVTAFSDFLATAIPIQNHLPPGLSIELWTLLGVTTLAVLLGTLTAVLLYLKNPGLGKRIDASWPGRLWFAGWGFDWLYDKLLVRPFCFAARINRRDAVDAIYTFAANLTCLCHVLLSQTQNGRLRWYALVLSGGTTALLLIAFSQ